MKLISQLRKRIHITSQTEEHIYFTICNCRFKIKKNRYNFLLKKYHGFKATYNRKIRHEQISFQTYNDLANSVKQLIQKLPSSPKQVVGIPRSGMIPAYMIGAFLNIPVCSIDEYASGIIASHGITRPLSTFHNVASSYILIVDDSVASGGSIAKAREFLLTHNVSLDNIKFAAIYALEEAKLKVDYFGNIVNAPRLFQWNYLHHGILGRTCMDIDGVLCLDPTNEENDDGENYMSFVINAKPLYIPPYKIRALVTARLEKYRLQTEEWLVKHNVQYDELYMLNLESAEERRRINAHAEFKAKIYSTLKDTVLFIESDDYQAEMIAQLSKKEVICSTTDSYYSGRER